MPFAFEKADLVKSVDTFTDSIPEAESKKCIKSNGELYDEYVSSIPGSDPNKLLNQNNFLESLRNKFFVFEIDAAKLISINKYVIRLTDQNNYKKKIVSVEVEGQKLKLNSYFELMSTYLIVAEIVTVPDKESTCWSNFKIILIVILAFIVISLGLALAFYSLFRLLKGKN